MTLPLYACSLGRLSSGPAYIAHDPTQRSDRSQLFLDFDHIERMQMQKHVLRHNTGLSNYIQSSPSAPSAQGQIEANYNRVKPKFMDKKAKSETTGMLATFLRLQGQLAKRLSMRRCSGTFMEACIHPTESSLVVLVHLARRIFFRVLFDWQNRRDNRRTCRSWRSLRLKDKFLDCAVNLDIVAVNLDIAGVAFDPKPSA